MTTPKFLMAGVLAVSLGAAVLPARAGDDCDAPVQLWQSRDAVRQMAARKGWEVLRLKIDDGCYEVRGRDAQGHSFKAKIDPQTLQIIETKSRERDGFRNRKRDLGGAAPHGQIE